MLSWTRRRLAAEAGISLVEMMVALMIFTVAAFALLGGLIASAQSVLDQQLRADATRVATQQLEAARTVEFDALDIDTRTETVTTGNGREVTVERTVEWIDAFDPSDALGSEDVKLVTVTVSWSDRGRDREVTYTTAIAPPDPEVVGGQALLAGVAPGAVEVDDDGVPVATVTLSATPDGFDYVGNMTGRWYRQDGTLATVQLAQVPSTPQWSAELDPADLTWPLDPGDEIQVELTVVAGAREATAVLTLLRPEATDPGPTVTGPVITPAATIRLTNPPGGSTNCGTTRCMNVEAVAFGVTVTPYSDTQVIEGVFVEFDLRDATSPTRRFLSVAADGVTWSLTVPAGAVQFAPGSAQPFSFGAIYDGGQETTAVTVVRQVVHQ